MRAEFMQSSRQPVTRAYHKQGFLLHGLWPEFLNGSWPQYCDPAAPFNMTSVQDLLPELHTYWPSLVAADQAAFWAHEWTRHGTCMEPFFGASAAKEHAYFRLVLTLREHFDAWAMLQAQGIGPASTTTWLQVKKALETGWPAKIEVGCNFDKKGTRQLLEVLQIVSLGRRARAHALARTHTHTPNHTISMPLPTAARDRLRVQPCVERYACLLHLPAIPASRQGRACRRHYDVFL